MKVHPGDHIVIAAPTTGGTVREGEILEVHGADGGPPYLVRWSQAGVTALFFPGSDAHVAPSGEATETGEAMETGEATEAGEATKASEQGPAAQVRSWRVNLDLFETEDQTQAHAVLEAEAPRQLDATGTAHRNPADQPVPEIGDEIAAARALRQLSDRLLELAAADIEEIAGVRVEINQ